MFLVGFSHGFQLIEEHQHAKFRTDKDPWPINGMTSSISQMNGQEASRRDDLESLFYAVFRGFEWKDPTISRVANAYSKIATLKQRTVFDTLKERHPPSL